MMDIDTPGEAGAGRPTRVSAVLWANELPLLSRVSSESGVVLEGWFPHDLLDADRLAACLASFRRADVILLHPSTGGGWDEVRAALPPGIPVVIFGTDP
ncbi:MAG TPA: hypothetical protein PLI31_02865, partial [Methanoregulaceae archaeon]|nr:hypothetical protein [Methanoregulaceae archaeon]